MLLRRVHAGDRGALGELLTAYQPRLYHMALRMVSNADDAAELTQDAVLKAIKHVDSFNAEARFSTWLMRILMNQAISHLRKRKLRKTVSLDQSATDNPASPTLGAGLSADREPGPDQRVENKDQIERLLNALEGIDPALRSVILLRDLQEMDYQQIAETLAMPIGTVKSRLFRARLALRKAIDQNQQQPPEPAHTHPRSETADG